MTTAETEVQLVDAFSDRPYAGNPAGVVLEASGLTEAQMRRIANELHASETAFVVGGTAGGEGGMPPLFRVRFFTPTHEVDFCGHATVAVISALCGEGRIPVSGAPVQATLSVRAGDLPIEVRPHPACGVEVIMTQAPARFAPFTHSRALLAGCLGIDRMQIPDGWPLALAYTGLWALVVPVANASALDQAKPDFTALAELNRKLKVVSTHLYTHAGPHALLCRDFSPAVGVFEDPVTGSALGATAALIVKEGAMQLTPPLTVLTASQGHAVGRPGNARIEVEHDDGGIRRVRVAGTAVRCLSGRIRID
jgi:PhzF family phenazine biosynthesis protein